MSNIVITEIADMRRWDAAMLAMRVAIKNGYPGTYRIASDEMHRIADKYDETKKPMLDVLLGL